MNAEWPQGRATGALPCLRNSHLDVHHRENEEVRHSVSPDPLVSLTLPEQVQ